MWMVRVLTVKCLYCVICIKVELLWLVIVINNEEVWGCECIELLNAMRVHCTLISERQVKVCDVNTLK